jgi:ATP-dependent DNA helicase RecG
MLEGGCLEIVRRHIPGHYFLPSAEWRNNCMNGESQNTDFKSLRLFTRNNPDWNELAKDCVCFANARGGRILIGIEDGAQEPPADQRIPEDLLEKVRRRITELTVNVATAVQMHRSEKTGGNYLEISISRSMSPASTTGGRFYLRVGDACKPLVGEEIQRLLNERNAQPWETLTTLAVPATNFDPILFASFVSGIRNSSRVKPSVKEKNDAELLDHYYLSIDGRLTNLGILCLGRREDRARLGTAPLIQFIKYDDDGRKVNKIAWDDHAVSPIQLINSVWKEIPDFRETYEFSEGLFRQQVPVYDQRVVRELLVNALVHRPYTQRGDIYLNLYPDRLEIVNPGLLPLGVTPRNILHQSVRRNNELARIFHDLELMEREGSGYDLLYEVLLSQGRPLPQIHEGPDSVKIIIEKRIVKPELIDFLAKADQRYSLKQREKIILGLLAQREAMTVRELAQSLDLKDTGTVAQWIGRLLAWHIIQQTGRTKGTRYFIDPGILRKMDFPSQTSLTRIEPHRLLALIEEDLQRHPWSSFGEIHQRIGPEIPAHQMRKQIRHLVEEKKIIHKGKNRWRRYAVS